LTRRRLITKAFSNCWPIYDPLQTKEFRIVAYKWLSDLKAKGCLGATIVRKSLLDDRQGERCPHSQTWYLITARYELLLLALSSHILCLRLPNGLPESRRLALSNTPDVELARVHCLIHMYQLSLDTRRRKQIHRETQSFATLLKEKDRIVSEKERNLRKNIDIESIIQQCQAEESRWERNWTTIKAEWVVDALRKSLSATPPQDFLSLSYQEAFINRNPSFTQPSPTTIQISSILSQTNIANLIAMEKQLSDEITRLESTLRPTPPRKSSLRKSLPPTINITPSTSPDKHKTNGYNLQFTRSPSRLSRSTSESPRSLTAMASEHGTYMK
jgi:hypothetical protein